MAIEIKKKPTCTVKSVSAPKRESAQSYRMTVNINLGSALVKDTNHRATHMWYGWKLSASRNISGTQSSSMAISSNSRKFTRSVNLDDFNGYNREDFFPYTSTRLRSVAFWCQPYNSEGDAKKVSRTRRFRKPKAPSISGFTVNENTGEVSVTISKGSGGLYQERAWTRYKVVIKSTLSGNKYTYEDDKFTGASKTVVYDASSYQQLSYGQYISITVYAWNQGFAGTTKAKPKTFYMSYPAQTTINSAKVSSRSATGKCTVYIDTGHSEKHPVDQVSLEYLPNCTYARASSIPGDESWTDANIHDDAQCTALAMPVANLIPDAGKYTWVRVKSVHAIENVLYRYSEPMRVKGLETPAQTAADDDIKILSTALGADRESVIVTMGWNADGTDDATGTELSWSDAEDSWRSTDPPSTYEFTWSDGALTDSGTTYQDSAEVTIKGLDAGQAVYIRARRYFDSDTERTFGDYSNAKAQIPSSDVVGEPGSVSLSLPGFVASGSSALASWVLGGGEVQTSWALVTSGGEIVANGTGTLSNYQIPYERLASLATDNEVVIHLEASTGGDAIVSDDKTVVLVDAPTLTLTAGSTLTAQPLSFGLSCNTAARIIATITAEGTGGQSPGGIIEQYNGDCIWYADLLPEWAIVSESSYTVTIQLDGGQAFEDGASYVLTVQAIDDETGLKSDAVTADFDVAWAVQAIAPDDCTVRPYEYVDNQGVHRITANIGIVAPSGARSTDVYDVYRYTADGAVLIGEGYPAGAQLSDEYAPFGSGMDLYYRIATRTVDGDVEFADIPYQLGGGVLRFDWPYGVLELPYDIDISDSYRKDTSSRQHMNGANEVYWNNGVKRTAKYSSRLIRLENQRDIAAARQLARYPGAVFVRTPDGSAFEADVQITDMSTSGALQLFNLSIEEISTTSDYMLPPSTEG